MHHQSSITSPSRISSEKLEENTSVTFYAGPARKKLTRD
jgi:hypothetical protein